MVNRMYSPADCMRVMGWATARTGRGWALTGHNVRRLRRYLRDRWPGIDRSVAPASA